MKRVKSENDGEKMAEPKGSPAATDVASGNSAPEPLFKIKAVAPYLAEPIFQQNCVR